MKYSYKIRGYIEDYIIDKTIVLKVDNLDYIPYTLLRII
jgi:hypothetical protein